jgi:hypothetical protein
MPSTNASYSALNFSFPIDSDYHVFTQLAARTDAASDDYTRQKKAFDEMIERVVNH